MKRVSMIRSRDSLLHVETPLGIVNITVGLHDAHGRRVEHVEIIPNDYAGEKRCVRRGFRIVELKGKARR